MSNVLTFTPRPKVPAPVELVPMTGAEVRTRLGEALQTALDAADHIIAVLDRMDGDADTEDGGDAEAALAAPENHNGAQVVWLRGNDMDREAEAPEVALPEMASDNSVIAITAVPWKGRGNVISATAIAILDMIDGRNRRTTNRMHAQKPLSYLFSSKQ